METEEQKRIRELEAEVERLRNLAYKDELTGAYNRRGFTEEVGKFLEEVEAFRKSPERRKSVLIKDLSVVLFDIDDFKKVNDTYGHAAGDKALQNVVNAIRKRVRGIDVVSRWGGEEILTALIGANEAEAWEIADNVRERLAEEKIRTDGTEIAVTISGGVAACGAGEQFESVIKRADEALYKAKQSGKNRIIKASEI